MLVNGHAFAFTAARVAVAFEGQATQFHVPFLFRIGGDIDGGVAAVAFRRRVEKQRLIRGEEPNLVGIQETAADKFARVGMDGRGTEPSTEG